MLNLRREALLTLKPYEATIGDFPVKLDANESPFDFPREMKERALKILKETPFNRYPGKIVKEVQELLARFSGVSEDMLVLGNGCDEIIQMILLGFGVSRKAVIPVPTFSMYKIAALVTGAQPVEIPLTPGFRLNTREILARAKDKAGVIFICNPNNPTGNLFPYEDIETILEGTRFLVAVDEAYWDFGSMTALKLMEKYERLVILRTLSKSFGLAGLRIGYAIARPEVARELQKVRQPYNMDSLSLSAAKVALENPSYREAFIRFISNERERVYRGLSAMKGVIPFESRTNFILFRTEYPARLVWERLKDRGVIVRDFSSLPLLEGCLRVTIGAEEENNAFLSALREVLTELERGRCS
ncbi:MAG TPA: histidinol-phosphate transaminase [Firmicutes bacterium]|nr:histidinol-phosphate transaminase [Candidatus Fermentithermobacillaceae bacterium]